MKLRGRRRRPHWLYACPAVTCNTTQWFWKMIHETTTRYTDWLRGRTSVSNPFSKNTFFPNLALSSRTQPMTKFNRALVTKQIKFIVPVTTFWRYIQYQHFESWLNEQHFLIMLITIEKWEALCFRHNVFAVANELHTNVILSRRGCSARHNKMR